MKYQKLKNTNFFEEKNYEALMTRLQNVKPDSKKNWGKMSVSQMLHHLNLATGSGLGFYQLADKSNLVSRNITKFVILEVLQKFPLNAETPSTLKVNDEFDFETEKQQLFQILTKAYKTQSDSEWASHTYFGKMTRKQWGKLIIIHCNHHFQ